jgi:3-methyl-2-oxobutanoate hydroxymethyltransferase
VSTTEPQQLEKVTTAIFRLKKQQQKPITMLTAYDYPTAKLIDQAGIDSILVGDTLGMVVLGYDTTLPVTMEDMLHHCKPVARGAKHALLIGDMPFLSYQVSVPEAVHNAGRFLKEGGMDAVKLEGGRERLEAVKAIISAGIPVMGHIGLTPQSVRQFGGFKVQGKTAEDGKHLLEDAVQLQEAGCFSLVLESIPDRLAAYISRHLEIPTIGIGAGSACDGQVLVWQDMVGLFEDFKPKFVKQYANLRPLFLEAFISFRQEVEGRTFPDREHSYTMPDDEWNAFLDMLGEQG